MRTQNKGSSRTLLTGAMCCALAACGGGGGSSEPAGTPPASSSSVSSVSSISSSASSASSFSASSASSTSSAASSTSVAALSPQGWASTTTGTTGGAGADLAHTYTVTDRSQLINALYTGAVIAADGSFTGTLDNSKKIINVVGTISLNSNAAGIELTGSDYLVAGACSYTSYSALMAAYNTVYAPNTWNTSLVGGKPPVVSGPEETARACGSAMQAKVVMISVGSNTTLQSKNGAGKIIHGNLVLSAPSDNIIIRNLQFEDSFDFFPQWTTTDSFPAVSATPDAAGCSTTTPTKCVGGRWNANYDLISVMGATHVWLDHNTLSDGSNIDLLYPPVSTWNFGGNPQTPEQKVQHHDGLIDITKNSNLVTVSYNYFHDHDKTGLIGGGDTASVATENPLVLKVTFHGNYYKNNKQRQPRARWGQIHAFNNYYSGQLANIDGSGPDYPWSVAYTAGTASKLWVENNVFEVAASADGLALLDYTRAAGISTSTSNYTKCTNVASKTWSNADCNTLFYDKGNLFNGAAVADFGFYGAIQTQLAANSANAPVAKTDTFWTPSALYSYTAKPVGDVKADVLSNAGAGKITLP